ncbi:hypothetical protein [Cellulomonas endometrii]|uniref:hypothetical protein n=1 Tax=Cellulomonas endometrii TaxID=3036301 RepID=UPI0024ACFB50|nr:hypothetical protein [Cellulomonas endometrii]
MVAGSRAPGRGATTAPPRTPAGRIRVPVLPRGVLARTRCVDALAAAVAGHRLVLVSAPAGYGKTTLLVQWAATADRPVAWVSLDALDDDPARLTRVLQDAVAQATRRAGAPREGTTGGPTPRTVAQGVDGLAARLDGLEGSGPAPVVVLDDIHLLSVQTARQVLGPLLRYPGTSFVLAGRYDAVVPLNRLRLSGELAELREDVLAFTPTEVADLVRALGDEAARDWSRALWELTGGWPVAVRLAITAGVLGGSGAPMRELRDRDVPITGYLVEEVIDALPAELADFVLRASLVDAIDPALAEAIAPHGARLLDECVARGLFLAQVADDDGGDPVYRWHTLVAAHAAAVLARRDPAAVRDTHRVVAEHVAARDPAAAITHALEGAAPDLAASILGERWPDLLVRGDVTLIDRLRSALPAPQRHEPDVLLALSAARAFEPADPGAEDPDRQPAAVTALVHALMAPGRPALEEAIRRGRAALADVDLDDGTRALGLYLLGRAELQRYSGDAAAGPRLAHGAVLAAQRGWVALELGCRAEESLATAHRGDLLAARTRAQDVLRAAAARGWGGTGITASAHLACGLVAYWRDELDVAHDHLDAAVVAAGRARPEVAVHAAGVLAITCMVRGDAAGLARARAVTDAPWTDADAPEHVRAFRQFLTAIQLDLERRPDAALALVDERTAAFGDPLALTWQSDLRRRVGDREGSWRALRAAISATDGVAHPLPQTLVAVRSAAALLHEDEHAAHEALEGALEAAAPQGVVRPLRDRAASLHPLLSDHLE